MNLVSGRFEVWAMRIIGTISLVFAAWGAWFEYVTLHGYVRIHAWQADTVGFRAVFVTLTSINLILLFLLVAGAILLLKRRLSGVTLSVTVFALEIASLLAQLLPRAIMPLSRLSYNLGSAAGVANMAVAPQYLTGYPLLGLIVLVIVWRRARRSILFTEELRYG